MSISTIRYFILIFLLLFILLNCHFYRSMLFYLQLETRLIPKKEKKTKEKQHCLIAASLCILWNVFNMNNQVQFEKLCPPNELYVWINTGFGVLLPSLIFSFIYIYGEKKLPAASGCFWDALIKIETSSCSLENRTIMWNCI